MDHLTSICESRGLGVPNFTIDEKIVTTLAEWVLEHPEYSVPVFASFRDLALPIASEWIIGPASTQKYPEVFSVLSRLAPLLPFLKPLMEHLLVMQSETPIAKLANENTLTGIMLLLEHDYSRYARYFSAEDLRSVASEAELPSTRTVALAALALLMEIGEHTFDNWVEKYCGTKELAESFKFDRVLKQSQARAEDLRLLNKHAESSSGLTISFENPLVTKIGGIYVPRIGGTGSQTTNSQFISTSNSESNLKKSTKALLTDKPILFCGPSGSGKTCIAEHLHDCVRGGELVRIHLGDQTDAKSLVGTYTTGEQAGTFEWTAGVLTAAVQNGSWILIEDIDRAPNEIVSVLLSLITSRELVIPSRNQVVKAAPGFQIIATTTTTNGVSDSNHDIIGVRSWEFVEFEAPNTSDLELLVRSLKPFLSPLAASMLVTTFRRIEEWQDTHRVSRKATTRDLIKLVNRIGQKYGTEEFFREAVSCFTSYMENPLPLAQVIGDSMAIPSSQIEPLLKRYQPSISISDQRLIVGRAEVERRSVTSSAARNLDSELQDSKFALTQPTLRLLEEISVGVQHSEPLLLVGETGTGKTAVIQHLAKLARRKLVVINVSQQVEAGDLIGGFKPVDARQLAGALLEEFFELFDATFSRAKNHQFVDVLERVIEKHQWVNVIKLLREAIKMAGARKPDTANNVKRARTTKGALSSEWAHFALQLDAFEERLKSVEQAAQFQFIEGLLVRAIRQGSWVLLDELNLAPADTIEGIGELLSNRQLTVLEAGGRVVKANPSFRLFANMNPATDVGKRDLPAAVRSQFTEIWSPSPESDQEALRAIITRYLPSGTNSAVINDVAVLYSEARRLSAAHLLVDGAGQRPHFSIRTLSRALLTATSIAKTYGLRRALYEAFCMCFLTLLDEASSERLVAVLDENLLAKIPNRNSVLKQIPGKPSDGSGDYIQFAHWWMATGAREPVETSEYILTPSVERNLLNLVRAASTKMFPILIQGPTSSGKTSMISYLAKRTGHSVVRINNHEHTDLAEYLGGYESDSEGRLIFKEGALVKALRNGDWLILDELNLAPTDVLEALNRLLDDNRELLVPETQEIIKPHPDFILFATQNPPGLYAGRKVLSRAFRNRFLELHFGDIPEQELEIILRERSGIAPSYAAKIVEVYRELARQRVQRVFEQAATLRDLFRWAKRPAVGYEELAFNGYALLGERSRSKADRESIKKVIEKVMKVNIDTNVANHASAHIMEAAPPGIVWTGAMRRVLALVEMALAQNEPILLVGETGCGKTTIVQTIAAANNQRLISLNAHQNTETGDLVGSQRPVRSANSTKLFEWVDGPLVVAMNEGSMFLLDEISLADDSVLERLNSVLEPERVLFVPEIGSLEAKPPFKFLSTMNPGGDYGKKELSPALRNRFTEIWCPAVEDESDLRLIIRQKLQHNGEELSVDQATDVVVKFSQWFSKTFGLVSLRDILSWIEFVNAVGISIKNLVHGAYMVFIDGLGIRSQFAGGSSTNLADARKRCLAKLEKYLRMRLGNIVENSEMVQTTDGTVNFGGFSLKTGRVPIDPESSSKFSLAAPTSALNATRVARALQVKKPVLLEGSPGAGKTSLIAALASICGEQLTRINLSDQTDLSDLFGQDVPLEEPGKFGWRSAPFLRAMQEGQWVLLDEMNLAPQPVLEGLNACLDHRGEAYIPELDRTFSKHPGFRVFAAQNPQGQGGGRKGLPKSFINRFTVVYVDQLGLQDLHAIAATTHPSVSPETREKITSFVEHLSQWSQKRLISGGPFEFNLRDTLRWLDLVSSDNIECPQKYFDLVILQRFRTNQDRNEVSRLFYQFFPPLHIENVNPLRISPQELYFGNSSLRRTGPKWQVHDLLSLLPEQTKILESGLRCVTNSWPMILVGPSGCGKTSIVRLLAQLCGARLREFAMTPDVDSTDLLGEFDQLEYESELQRLWNILEDQSGFLTNVESATLIDAIHKHDLDAVKSLLPSDSITIQNAIKHFESLDFSRPVFHWVDGMLVRAVENGDWLVLDNANLCSAAVLDRLNSLLERNGTLLVNECAQNDGSPREIKPHPNFRLFLTVNPKFGELSRAMRNRGVEVWLMPLTNQYSTATIGKISYGGASPLQFSRPLTLARLADVKSKSWLKAAICSVEETPAEYLPFIDSTLASFWQSITEDATEISTVNGLYERWLAFTLRRALEEVMSGASRDTLLGLSALHRLRDSVDCEFDLYGVIAEALPFVIGGGELGSVLTDLVTVADPSRIPVFRDMLVKACEERGFASLIQIIHKLMGQEYDFSEGGAGMERLWNKLGRHLGFPDDNSQFQYLQVQNLAKDFDATTSQLDLSVAEQVASIRIALSTVHQVDEKLLEAVEGFEKTIMASLDATKINPDNGLLQGEFKDIWSSFGLLYCLNPSEKLKNELAKLALYSGVSTWEFKNLMSATQSSLGVPSVLVPRCFEGTVIEILQKTPQGQASREVEEFTRLLEEHSFSIVDSMKPHTLLSEIIRSVAKKVVGIVPEISQFEGYSSLCAGEVKDSGIASISLAYFLLYLYVCPLPMDPAIGQHVRYERYLRLEDELRSDIACWSELQTIFASESYEIENYLSTLQVQKEPVPSVWRPQQSTAAMVHRDMVAAKELAKAALRPLDSEEQMDVILKNSENLFKRLERAHGYQDLASVAKIALSLLRIGVSLKKHDHKTKDNHQADKSLAGNNLWLMDPTIVGYSAPVSVDYPLLVLKSMAGCRRVPVDNLQELTMDVYRRWTLERLKVEEKKREEAAGFRYTDDEGEDAVAEREFRLLFPDYDEVPELPKREDTFESDFVRHYCIALENDGKSDDGTHTREAVVSAVEELNQAMGPSSPMHLPAIYLALSRRCKRDLDPNRSLEINFYTDSSSQESRLSVKFAELVRQKISVFLNKWPEHDTLQTLVKGASDIMLLPPHAPVAMHLSKVEQIFHYLYEWDRFASKDVKVGDLMAEASSLVVRWRRMELSSWPALFSTERKRSENAAAPFWFHLFETLIAAPSDNVADTAKVLIIFMSESPIGQWCARLSLLKTFEIHLGLLGEHKTRLCVANVHDYFSMFTSQNMSRLGELEKALRKQVTEVVQLASWRDVNIHALKQSAQRSHRQLFKIVKKYRALLETKVNTELDIYQVSASCSVTSLSPKPHSPFWSEEWMKNLNVIDVWQNRPRHLREIGKTTEFIRNYGSKVNAYGDLLYHSSNIFTLASDVEARSKKLRDETPKTWSKENKKMINALRTEKQQLLTETLRELRKSGLHQSVTKSTIANQNELIKVLANKPHIPGEIDTHGLDSLIEILPRLRSAVSDACGKETVCDVPQSDLQRAMATAENLFSYILRLRKVASRHFESSDLDTSEKFIDSLKQYAKSDLTWEYEIDSAKKSVENTSQLLQNVLGTVSATLEGSEATYAGASEVLSALSICKEADSMTDLEIRSKATDTWLANVDSRIRHLTQIYETKKNGGLVVPVLKKLSEIVGNVPRRIAHTPKSGSIEQLESAVTGAARSVLVIVQELVKLLPVTDEKPLKESATMGSDGDIDDDDEEEENEWLTKTAQQFEKLLRTLRSREIWGKFHKAAHCLCALDVSDNKSAAAGYAANIVAFAEAYRDISELIECRFMEFMQATTAGTLKLSGLLFSLANNGFCSPQPTDDDDDDDEERGDGVGLGDGQGGKSSSKDIDEEDDDVTEAMQTANPEQEERDEADDGEDNAKEMEGDMAGENENMPAKDEDDEESDDNGSQDDEDIDDEVGDLDDLDPNAVDEKMWDDQKEDLNEKEKQTDAGVQGEKDEDQQAGEDNDSHQQDQKPNDEKGEGQDEPENGDDDDDGQDEGSESDAEAHQDDINQGDREDLEPDVEQKDALDLPDDMKLDGEDMDENQNDDAEDDGMSDGGDEEEEEQQNEEDMVDDIDAPQDSNATDEGQDDDDDQDLPDEAGQANEANAEDDEMDLDQDEEKDENMSDAEKEEGKEEQENEDASNDSADDADDALQAEDANMIPEGQEGGDDNGAEIEGINGPENSEPKTDEQSTTTEQRTGSSGEGAAEDANQEQQQTGTGSGSRAQKSEDQQDNANDQAQRDPIKESLKQLGDAMKEYHKRQRAIKEHDPSAEDTDSLTANDDEKPLDGTEDLEHVGASDRFDTQALGKAGNEDERQDEIDEKMAIDDDANRADEEDVKDVAGDEADEAEHGAGGAMEEAFNDNSSDEEEDAEQPVANAGGIPLDEEEEQQQEEDDATDMQHDQQPEVIKTEEGDHELWSTYESKVHDLSLILGEQLRLILEPTVASKLRGDYRTGKRLNMKRIIPYIASEFRKDKIWLRRTKPAKREYQILLALDDSKSMGEPIVVDLAFQAIALVGKALNSIEAGQIGIAKFGSSTDIVHSLDTPFTPQAGNKVLSQFGFNQQRTNVHQLLQKSLEMFAQRGSSAEQWKLEIIVSDGISDDHAGLRTLVRRAYDERVMVVFIVLDALNKDTSILDMNEVRYSSDEYGNPKLEVVKYMEDFPFDYYVIVKNIGDLPTVLASVLRQYFQAADL